MNTDQLAFRILANPLMLNPGTGFTLPVFEAWADSLPPPIAVEDQFGDTLHQPDNNCLRCGAPVRFLFITAAVSRFRENIFEQKLHLAKEGVSHEQKNKTTTLISDQSPGYSRCGGSDLAIGVPGENFETGDGGDTGRVVIIFGSPEGLDTTPSDPRLRPQDITLHDDVPDYRRSHPHWGHLFGESLAWGDFNSDGFGDLAIGAGEFTINTEYQLGAVIVLYGSQGGIGAWADIASKFFFTLSDFPQFSLSPPRSGDLLGTALTSGDFNGDGRTDLVVGIPGRDVYSSQSDAIVYDVGELIVMYCTTCYYGGEMPEGLIEKFSADDFVGFPGANSGDKFGSNFAAGDFNGDDRDDLAIGVPGKDFQGLFNAGAVYVRYGTESGLKDGFSQYLVQGSLFAGANESGDHFGSSLAAGDFNGDGRKDLAIGVPGEDVFVSRNNSFVEIADAGEVNVIYGSSLGGLSIKAVVAPQRWHQDVSGIEDAVEEGDRYGSSLSAWNFGRNATLLGQERRFADLAVGIPREDVGSPQIRDAGAVNVLYGGLFGLNSSGDQFWTQTGLSIPGTSEAYDYFGSSLY